MHEEIAIEMAAGPCEATICRPSDSTKKPPGAIFFTDIGGIRKSQVDMAERLAGLGYVVLIPNIFYRNARPPVFQLPPDTPPEARMKRMGELAAPLQPEAVEEDTAKYVDFLLSVEGVAGQPIGVVGYCFSGAVAMRCAAVRPDAVAACASFHGGRLATDQPSSPHLLLPRIKAELYFGHADNDSSMPAEMIAALDRALEAWGGKFASETYEGARHSWTVLDSPVYNHEQAERAFGKLADLFARNIATAAYRE